MFNRIFLPLSQNPDHYPRMKTYEITKTNEFSPLNGEWSGKRWAEIPHLNIDLFHPQSSSHHPETQLKLAYDEKSIYGIFKVEDQYIRSTTTSLQDNVCRDSCVEFFFKPKTDAGYFNFEFNCGGNMLCHYSTMPRQGKIIDIKYAEKVEILHSLPSVVDPEITEPTTWFLEFNIPFAVLEEYCGNIGNVSGTKWTANFYKCGDKTSHPHWASYAPISKLDFHLPDSFVPIVFE